MKRRKSVQTRYGPIELVSTRTGLPVAEKVPKKRIRKRQQRSINEPVPDFPEPEVWNPARQRDPVPVYSPETVSPQSLGRLAIPGYSKDEIALMKNKTYKEAIRQYNLDVYEEKVETKEQMSAVTSNLFEALRLGKKVTDDTVLSTLKQRSYVGPKIRGPQVATEAKGYKIQQKRMEKSAARDYARKLRTELQEELEDEVEEGNVQAGLYSKSPEEEDFFAYLEEEEDMIRKAEFMEKEEKILQEIADLYSEGSVSQQSYLSLLDRASYSSGPSQKITERPTTTTAQAYSSPSPGRTQVLTPVIAPTQHYSSPESQYSLSYPAYNRSVVERIARNIAEEEKEEKDSPG